MLNDHFKVTTHGALQQKEMNNRIGPNAKQVCNIAMYVLHIFGVCHNHNSLPLGPIQSSSPSTKELRELPHFLQFAIKGILYPLFCRKSFDELWSSLAVDVDGVSYLPNNLKTNYLASGSNSKHYFHLIQSNFILF